MAQSINITELNLPQLEMLKNQLDQEVEFLSTSIAQLKVVQTKYVEAKDCLNVLNKSNEGKELLVPLTSSMYVPGKLHDVEHVLIDVGTGYYVEKTAEDAKDFFKRKIDFLTKQMEKIQPALQEKHAMKQVLQAQHRMLGSEQDPPAKRLRNNLMAPPRIGTHNGTFHCDEALACALLRLLPEYANAEIVRTRDPEKLASCDIVVDVGGEYNPQSHRYDHHQRTFTETMSSLCPGKPWQTKLSSAGLVYLHFGRKLLAQLLGTSEEDSVVDTIYDKAGFRRAMDLVQEEFLQRLNFYQHSWLPARALVEEALAQRFKVDSSGEIVELAKGGCPWKEHLYHLESELSPKVAITFVIYTDQAGQWRVQCVPKEPHSFQSRLPLPEPWRGLRDKALDQVSGIPGCIFVHASGFIGGHHTREGALNMARATLAQRPAPVPLANAVVQ